MNQKTESGRGGRERKRCRNQRMEDSRKEVIRERTRKKSVGKCWRERKRGRTRKKVREGEFFFFFFFFWGGVLRCQNDQLHCLFRSGLYSLNITHQSVSYPLKKGGKK